MKTISLRLSARTLYTSTRILVGVNLLFMFGTAVIHCIVFVISGVRVWEWGYDHPCSA